MRPPHGSYANGQLHPDQDRSDAGHAALTGGVLRTMAERQNELLALSKAAPAATATITPPATLPPMSLEFLRQTAAKGVQWAAAILATGYVMRGGDIGSALKMLAGFFG